MHTSHTNHKQTLISYLLQYYFSVYYIWFVIFLRSEWSGEYNGLLTWDFSLRFGGEKEK